MLADHTFEKSFLASRFNTAKATRVSYCVLQTTLSAFDHRWQRGCTSMTKAMCRMFGDCDKDPRTNLISSGGRSHELLELCEPNSATRPDKWVVDYHIVISRA